MSTFWKLVAMGATAAAAVVVAKEVIERTERGEDCSPMAVVKGIGAKIGDWCSGKCACEDCCDEDFDDFEDFELDEDDGVDFDTADMESDKLTDEGYIMEFNAEDEPEVQPVPAETPASAEEAPAEEPAAQEPAAVSDDEENEEDVSTDE